MERTTNFISHWNFLRKTIGQNFSLRYPEAWSIRAITPLIWKVEAEV
jgi:hypothetical protein